MTRSLAGLAVIVTRPARQAQRFVQLLQDHGATAIAFPTLAIEPVTLDDTQRRACMLDAFDWIIYTSANAVEQSIPQIGRPGKSRVGAIGRATARALADARIAVHAVPEAGSASDSEGLLAHPGLAGPGGRRILIVKGVGGRDVLRAGLAARGAEVSTAEVYRRIRPAPSRQALDELGRANEAGAVVATVTSSEVLESLLEMVPAEHYPWLRDAPLLVPGDRVAAEARRLQWRGPLLVAGSAEDETMLAALRSWSAGNGLAAPA
ncbi:MAG: uroporphyrinogen-III synthase [Steroidobacteraceae bacterium]|nr:uroporphyrinogen-III synthase [Steroidobacteraceae bacterium]